MPTFAMTFRIDYDSSYDERYDSFVKEIRKRSPNWEDTTSFFVLSTNESIDTFADAIYYGSKFNAAKDLYLIMDTDKKSAVIRGKVLDQSIFGLIPYLRKL